MAQTQSRTGGQIRPELQASNLAVSLLASGNTQLLEVKTLGLTRIMVHLDATVQALDAFLVKARAHPGAAFDTIYSTAGAFTSPAGLIVGASGDLTALAAAASGWFIMDVAGLESVQVHASAAVDGALVDIYASGS